MGESTTGTQQNPARELFKYRVVNEYTLSFLRTGAVYFSSPQELNDPFDVRFVEREHRAGGVKTRVYCLSEIVDSVLMWSHYADSHRGICVVLKAEERGEPWWIPFASSSINLARGSDFYITTICKQSRGIRIGTLVPSLIYPLGHLGLCRTQSFVSSLKTTLILLRGV